MVQKLYISRCNLGVNIEKGEQEKYSSVKKKGRKRNGKEKI
jgi:hypothetical protein